MLKRILTTVLALVMSPLLFAADDTSIEETLRWINATLRDNDPDFTVGAFRSERNFSILYLRHFNVTLTESGNPKISWDLVTTGFQAETQPLSLITQNWRAFSPEHLSVVEVRQTLEAKVYDFPKTKFRKVIGIKKSDGMHELLPLPPNEELHPRILKALRHLLEKSKSDLKEPF